MRLVIFLLLILFCGSQVWAKDALNCSFTYDRRIDFKLSVSDSEVSLSSNPAKKSCRFSISEFNFKKKNKAFLLEVIALGATCYLDSNTNISAVHIYASQLGGPRLPAKEPSVKLSLGNEASPYDCAKLQLDLLSFDKINKNLNK